MNVSTKELLGRAVVGGAIVCGVTAAIAAVRGRRDTGSALAPINATTHVVWGDRAADVEHADLRHTLLGLAINGGASLFWSAIYEHAFGETAESGAVARAMLGGGAVALLAYGLDYRLIPSRLTPGWEHRVSPPSLALIFAGMALSLPARGLLHARSAGSLGGADGATATRAADAGARS